MTMEENVPLSSSLMGRQEPSPDKKMDTRIREYDDGGRQYEVNNGNDNSEKIEIGQKINNVGSSGSIWEYKYQQELSRAYNLNSFCLLIGQSLRFMGFSEYSLYYLDDNSKPLVSIFTTMPEEENNAYFSDTHWKHDPIRDYAMKENDGILLSTISNYIDSCPFQLESLWCSKVMFAHLESFGYHDLYIIPSRLPNSEGCLILTVATKDRNIDVFHTLISKNCSRLQSLITAIEFVGTKKFPSIFLDQNESKKIPIDPNSLKLLQIMVGDDLKLVDAAKQFNISRDIANRYIKSIRNALRADTTARAIYLATKAGLIEEKDSGEKCSP